MIEAQAKTKITVTVLDATLEFRNINDLQTFEAMVTVCHKHHEGGSSKVTAIKMLKAIADLLVHTVHVESESMNKMSFFGAKKLVEQDLSVSLSECN